MITPPQFESNPTAPSSMGPELDAAGIARQLDAAMQAVQEKQSAEEQRLKALHDRLYGFFVEEQERQAANRFQMALDEDYFDSLQWDEDEIRKLEARNQAALVYNAIKPMVLWVTGTEKRTRIDYRVLARKKDTNADKEGEHKTEVMKFTDDVNMSQFSRSQAFKECVVSGLSWLEDGATNNPGELPVYAGWESWKNVLHDSLGNDFFGKDWRYMFRWREMDEDIGVAMWPNDAEHIKLQCTNSGKPTADESGWYLGTKRDSVDWPNPSTTAIGRRNFIDLTAANRSNRRRFRAIEAWYRVPKQTFIVKGQVYDGEKYDPQNPGMKTAFDQGAITIVNQIAFEMRVAFMTDGKVLEDRVSPYRHNDFPFTPIWCYRRGRDGAPYGIVREMRDPQDSLNKHMSKAQWHLAANQIIAGKDAIANWKSARRNADKANGTIILDGPNPNAKFEMYRGTDKAQQHVEMAKFDMSLMRENYGLNIDNLGIQSNAQSGRAILARQDQGSVQTQPIFDNLRLAVQLEGEKRLSLVEQYLTDEMQLRVTGEKRGTYDYLEINKPIRNADGSWTYLNDITATKADFIVDEQDYRATIRQAMAETMADMISKMPSEIGFKFLDMWVELLDIPNKDDYIKRIRQLNGMGDEGDPTTQAVNQVKQQAQQQLQAVQQGAEKALQGLQAENARLKQLASTQALRLAGRAEELRLKAIQIDNTHAENMATIEVNREAMLRKAADAAAKAQVNGQVDQQRAQTQAKYEADRRQLEEYLADVKQAITELGGTPPPALPAMPQPPAPPAPPQEPNPSTQPA